MLGGNLGSLLYGDVSVMYCRSPFYFCTFTVSKFGSEVTTSVLIVSVSSLCVSVFFHAVNNMTTLPL